MPMPSAHGNITIMDKEFGINSKKSSDELKRQVAKLKAELESERTKLKQVHRDKTAELKRIQENHEKERHRTVESVTKRLHSEHAVELRRLRENLGKEKDIELRQVLKFKDEELKALKQQIQDEKERSKRAEDDNKKFNVDRNRGNSSEVEQLLRNDVDELKEQKRKLDELYRLKCAADFEKAELIRRLKSEHEREVNALIRESKREVAKEFHHLRSAEKALEEKNHELAFKDQLTKKLEAEKHEIRQRKTSVESNLSDSPLRSRLGSGTAETSLSEVLPGPEEVFQSSPKGRYDKERELRKKNAELQSRLDQLEKKCTMLEKNNSAKHSGSQKASGLVEEKVKKLKKRNSELVSIARQLEEKAKKLQDEKNATMKQANSKADPSSEVEHMKKMFARQRAKDLAEQAKFHMQKDNEIESLRNELETLSGSKPQHQNDKVDELQEIIKKTAKERLILEKKLATIESPSSSPTPAGYKLKPSAGDSSHLHKELEMKEKECESLKKLAEEMKGKCSKLELEREKFAAKCTMLHQKNAEFGKRVKELNKLEEEIKTLKDNLQKAEHQRNTLEQDCLKLREQLKDLMHVKQDLETSEKQRKVLEKENKSSVFRLNEREEEIRQLHKIQEESTRVHRFSVTSLENDIRSLHQKCADSNDRANNLKNELEKLKTSKTSNQHKATQTSLLEPVSPALRQETKRETVNVESVLSSKDILDVAASRIKQLELSDSEEDSLSAPSDSNKKTKPSQSDDDDIASLSRRINQATYSDDSTSLLDDNDESDASRDVNSMAEGDLADMEDNDITTSMIDGEETGNDLSNYLDSNSNVNKEIKHPENTKREGNQVEESIDEKYLTSEHDSESDSEFDEENLAVYIARYSYDPYQHSPNDCPEAELAFQAGDYLYVFGDVDEDGFFLGELMDGQRGMVPSNFVEKIADEDELPWIVNGGQDEQTDDTYGSDEEQAERKLHRNLRLNVEHIPDSNLGDIEEEDGESREALNSSHDGFRSDDTDLEPIRIPSPKHIMLERQHTRSIVINWKPADLPANEVKGYGVYVNGEMRMMVKGGNNTKALIEDIDPTKTYRISVRTITVLGEQSHDQEATLTIGKDASVAPSNLQVSDVTPTSAKIEWIPGNSSYNHEIIVNDTPLRTIKPGTYQYTLANLEPKEHYRVYVRARNPKIFLDEDSQDIGKDSLAEVIEFTTQEGGVPDPPLNVHLVPTTSRSGPNTLEVSWIPVTITEQGTSNGARVTGYKVYINDVTCAEVTSPTADCVTVASWMIERAVKKTKAETVRLTVRTQSALGESITSNVLSIPLHTFNFQINKLIGAQPRGTPVKPKHQEDEALTMGTRVKTKHEDDLQPVETPVKTKHQEDQIKPVGTLIEPKHKANESRNKDISNQGKVEIEKPVAKPRQDTLVPPVPKARTKGKPTLWKVDIDDEDSLEDSNRSGGNSTVDEDEQVEICNDVTDDKHTTTDYKHTSTDKYDKHPATEKDDKHSATEKYDKHPATNRYDKQLATGKDDKHPATEKYDKHPATEKDDKLPATDKDVKKKTTGKDVNHTTKDKETSKIHPKENQDDQDKIVQELSDNQNRLPEGYSELLNDSPQAIIRDTNNADKPTSEVSERKISGLSDIDVDELNDSLKSATSYKRKEKSKPKPATKEPFLTPDDLSDSEIGDSSDESLSVIDEEDEEEEVDKTDNSAHKRSSRSSRTHSATDSFRSDDDVMDLLGEGSEEVQPAALTAANIRKFSKEQQRTDGQEAAGNNNEQALMKYLVNSEQQAGSNDDSGHEEDIKDQTYSDVEADQFEPTGPYETSTPTMQRKSMDDEQTLQGDANDIDNTPNRTYTLEDGSPDDVQEEEPMRIFIALYDYNPAIQSPNPDAEDEELAFNEGDLMKIYGDIDPDGFYWGEMDGRAGFVPHNMVSEVQVDEEDLLDQTPSPVPESQTDEYLQRTEALSQYSQNGHHTERDPNQQLNEHHTNRDPYQQPSEHHTNIDPYQQRNEHHNNRYSYQQLSEHHTNGDPYQQQSEHHTNGDPYQQPSEHHTNRDPYQQPSEHHTNRDPNQDQSPENHTNDVPRNEYLYDNVPNDNRPDLLPVDGKHTQNPKVVVHKPSDASLHEPNFQAPEDLNPVPHDVSNETYNVIEGDGSMELEDPRTSLNYSLEPRKMVALFDYDPQMLSPNPDSEVELKFRSGDIMYVYGEMDEDGFYTGEISGVRGLVPSNFLEEVQDSTSLPPSQEPSDISVVSEESSPGPSKTPNGTQSSSKEETAKKKKGIFSKGKQMLKKMTKGQASKK